LEISQNLKIEGLYVARNELCPDGVIRISWRSDAGLGQYDIVLTANPEDEDAMPSIDAYSEAMDSNEDKAFLRALLGKLAEAVNIRE
jgi:hypothetical protein